MLFPDYLTHRRGKINSSVDALTLIEAKILGIGWPLRSGWKQAHSFLDINELLFQRLDQALNDRNRTDQVDSSFFKPEEESDFSDHGVVEIFTDGACKGNPGGRGGWGVFIKINGIEREFFGGEPSTTNNRMELMAAISALEILRCPRKVKLHTDSKYVQQGISDWIHGWKRRNWKTSGGDPVKNEDLWRKLDAVAAPHVVEWIWVRGHNGHVGNERADWLANQGCRI